VDRLFRILVLYLPLLSVTAYQVNNGAPERSRQVDELREIQRSRQTIGFSAKGSPARRSKSPDIARAFLLRAFPMALLTNSLTKGIAFAGVVYSTTEFKIDSYFFFPWKKTIMDTDKLH
jgi:hypothetical protein